VLVGALCAPDYTGRGSGRVETCVRLVPFVCVAELAVDLGVGFCALLAAAIPSLHAHLSSTPSSISLLAIAEDNFGHLSLWICHCSFGYHFCTPRCIETTVIASHQMHTDSQETERSKRTISTRFMRAEPSRNLGRDPRGASVAIHAELAV
jgi:hypothetical protein